MSTNMVSKAIKNIQKSNGVSCKELASIGGVSPCAISRYGLGDRQIPEDVVVNLANGGYDELKLAYLAEKKLDIVNVPNMNNIDDNIQTMILRLAGEEIPEAVQALNNISKLTMNKKFLLAQEMDQLYKEVEQVVDLIPGIKTFLIRLKQMYSIDLQRIDQAECEKFKQRNYVIEV